MRQIVPIPQIDVSVRKETLADVPFIDQLQKLHSKQVGFMRTSWIEAKIAAGHVIVAEELRIADCGMRIEELNSNPKSEIRNPKSPTPLGYCMGVDRYQKHDDIGIIHQLNVVPGKQRGFVGATLLRAMFERAAYGCKLFCCWCAQDIDANRFWEAMGFVPLAYRAGSEKKRRVHVFWQKRIREGDTTTPWWFPAATNAGAMNADRLVLPIPPGLHWSDEMPVVIRPGDEQKPEGRRQISDQTVKAPAPKPAPVRAAVVTRANVLRFAPVKSREPAKPEKKIREKKPKAKNDPKLAAAARELRDRWLEQINSGTAQIESSAKYDVARALPDRGRWHLSATAGRPTPLLPAA